MRIRPFTPISRDGFKALLQAKAIRPASLEDVHGTHHQRKLYQHPNTKQPYVEVATPSGKIED